MKIKLAARVIRARIESNMIYKVSIRSS